MQSSNDESIIKNDMKKLIATIAILGITCATSHAWYGGGSGWGNGYGGASGTCGYGGYRGYNSYCGAYGGYNGGGCGYGGGGWGYGNYSSTQTAVTLNGIANIIGAVAPILAPPPVVAPPQPMPYYPSGYIAPRPVVVY